MFKRKSKTEKAADAAADRAQQAADVAAQLRDRAAVARDRAAARAQQGASRLAHDVRDSPMLHDVRDRVGPKAAAARDRAVHGLDRGIDAAVPRASEAIGGVAPKVDAAHDYIVDDVLPKLQEWLIGVQASKDDILSRQDGAAAAVTGTPKKRKRKGGVLLTFGLLAAVGAGIAWYLNQQQNAPKTDPWAGSTGSRPVGGAPGVDSQVRESLGSDPGTGATSGTAGTSGTVGASAGATSATGTAAGTTAGAAATGTTAPAGDATGDDAVRVLESEEIDELGADVPASADEAEVPGTNTDATTGLGQDREVSDVLDDVEEGRDTPKGPGLP